MPKKEIKKRKKQLSAAAPTAPKDQGGPEYDVDHDVQDEAWPAGENDCAFCFLSPCVTSYPHDFLGQGQAACDANSGLRKEQYRRYWKVISNHHGWNHPRYVAKKRQAGHGGGWTVIHMREIMPECVLKQVRGLYPNPPSRPYMGHKWE